VYLTRVLPPRRPTLQFNCFANAPEEFHDEGADRGSDAGTEGGGTRGAVELRELSAQSADRRKLIPDTHPADQNAKRKTRAFARSPPARSQSHPPWRIAERSICGIARRAAVRPTATLMRIRRHVDHRAGKRGAIRALPSWRRNSIRGGGGGGGAS